MKKAKSKQKRQTKRSRAKYPALRPDLNLKTRYDLLDYDYLHKLSEEELEWLNKFTSEEIHADFRHTKPLNKTKKARRRIYASNNARNRCLYTREKAQGKLNYIVELSKKNDD